jgi:signal peptidase II
VNFGKRLSILLFTSLSCVGCDQTTKVLATKYLPNNAMDSFLLDTLRLGYIENTGSFLSLGASLPQEFRFWLFTVATGLLLCALFAYLVIYSKEAFISFTGYSLFFAGGISNFYDRATNNGAVIDFLNIGIGPVRTGVFNIADVAIMLGFAMLVFSLSSFRFQRKRG